MTTAAAATTMDAPMFHSRPSIQEGDIVILFMVSGPGHPPISPAPAADVPTSSLATT